MYNNIHKLYTESSNLLDKKENLSFNFEKWKRNTSHNLLYITGHSGSGKSTLSEEIAKKHNAKIIEIDYLEWYVMDTEENNSNDDVRIRSIIHDFLDDNPDIKERVDNEWDGLTREEMGEDICTYIGYIKKYAYENQENLYIIEGLQIYEYLEGEELDDEPVIIKDTGALKAFYRRLKRDNGGEDLNLISFIKHLKNNLDLIPWYNHDRKLLNKFKKGLR